MRHDPGLAASPPVRYILEVERSGCSSFHSPSAVYDIHPNAWRNCLENPDGLHSEVLWVGKTGCKAPLSPLCDTKKTRSRPVQLFSKQFRKGYSQKFVCRKVDEMCSPRSQGDRNALPTREEQPQHLGVLHKNAQRSILDRSEKGDFSCAL